MNPTTAALNPDERFEELAASTWVAGGTASSKSLAPHPLHSRTTRHAP